MIKCDKDTVNLLIHQTMSNIENEKLILKFHLIERVCQ